MRSADAHSSVCESAISPDPAAAALILSGTGPTHNGKQLPWLSPREAEIRESTAEAERIYRYTRLLGDRWEGYSKWITKGSRQRRQDLQREWTTQEQIDSAQDCGPEVIAKHRPQSLKLLTGNHSGLFQREGTGKGIDLIAIGPGMRTVRGDRNSICDWLRSPGRLHGCFPNHYIGHLVTTGIFNDRDSLVAATLRRAIAIGLDPRLNRIAIFDHGRHTHALFSTIDLHGGRWQTPFGVAWILWAHDNWDRMQNREPLLSPLIARKRSAHLATHFAMTGRIVARIGKDEHSLLGSVTEQRMLAYPGCWYGCLPLKQAFSRLVKPRSVADLVRYCTRAG